MVLARALRLVLAVALLAAWQGALVHPLEHADEHGALVHFQQQDEDGRSDGQELCDALAAVATFVDSVPPLAIAFASTAPRAFRIAYATPPSTAPPAYRSQAPPQVS